MMKLAAFSALCLVASAAHSEVWKYTFSDLLPHAASPDVIQSDGITLDENGHWGFDMYFSGVDANHDDQISLNELTALDILLPGIGSGAWNYHALPTFCVPARGGPGEYCSQVGAFNFDKTIQRVTTLIVDARMDTDESVMIEPTEVMANSHLGVTTSFWFEGVKVTPTFISAVPEPSTWSLATLGVLALGWMRRRSSTGR